MYVDHCNGNFVKVCWTLKLTDLLIAKVGYDSMLVSLRRNMMSGSFYLGISSIIFMSSGYVLSIYLARKLSPSPFGTYSLVISLMTALNILQSSGLPQVITKQIAESPQHEGAILRNAILLQAKFTIALTFIYCLLALPIANILNDQSLMPYILCSGLALPSYGIYALYFGYRNGLHDYKRLALASTVYSIGKLVFVVWLLDLFGLYGAICGYMIAPLIALPICFKIHGDVHLLPDSKLLIQSIPLIGYAIFINLMVVVDIFILRALNHSYLNVGFYAAAQNIARLPFLVIGVLVYILYPAIAKLLASNDLISARIVLTDNLKNALYLLVPMTVIIAASASEILSLLYGDVYRDGAVALLFLLLGGSVLTIFNLLAYVLIAAGKAKVSMALSGIGLTASAVFCLFLVNILGMTGAALSICLGASVSLAGALLYVQRIFKSFFPIKALMISMAASVVVVIPIIEIEPKGFNLFLACSLAFIFYLMLLLMFKQVKWPIKVRA